MRQLLAAQLFVGNRLRAGAGCGHHVAPEWLANYHGRVSQKQSSYLLTVEICSLSKERYNGRWPPIQQAASGCSGATVVDYRGDVLKEPFVGTVSKPEDVL
jgi:hypothetical protein